MPNRERYDLMSSVFVRLGGDPNEYKTLSSQDLLMTIFSGEYTVREIESKLNSEYDFRLNRGLKEDMNEMCNLSYGVEERGIQKGIMQGMAQGRTAFASELSQEMKSFGLTADQEEALKEFIKNRVGCE